MAHRLGIVGGPGMWKWNVTFFDTEMRKRSPLELLLELEEGRSHNDSELAEISALCADPYIKDKSRFVIHVIIDQIEWKSDDGQSWNFRGWLVRAATKDTKVRGFYSTKTNHGHVIIETAEEAERARLTRAARDLDTFFFNKNGTVRRVSRDLPCQEFFKALGWANEEEARAAEKAGLI